MFALPYSQEEGAALNVYTVVQEASRETRLLWIPKKLCDRTGRRAQIIAYPLSIVLQRWTFSIKFLLFTKVCNLSTIVTDLLSTKDISEVESNFFFSFLDENFLIN